MVLKTLGLHAPISGRRKPEADEQSFTEYVVGPILRAFLIVLENGIDRQISNHFTANLYEPDPTVRTYDPSAGCASTGLPSSVM